MICKLLGAKPITMRVGHKVLPLDETGPPQPLKKCDMKRRTTRSTEQATKAINPAWLLRPRGERPQGHAAEQGNELPPSCGCRVVEL